MAGSPRFYSRRAQPALFLMAVFQTGQTTFRHLQYGIGSYDFHIYSLKCWFVLLEGKM